MVTSSLRVELFKIHHIPGVRQLFPISIDKEVCMTRKGFFYNKWAFPIFLQFTSWTSGSDEFPFQNKFAFLKLTLKDPLLVKPCKPLTINLSMVDCHHPLLI